VSWTRCIQQVYVNSFSSIWEYKEAFQARKIDWRSVTGDVCPVCGKLCRFHRISPYERLAIELFPYREERIPVARFRCGSGQGTFSMLPYQLVPYHRYTLESMVFALLLWWELREDEESSGSGYSVSRSLSWKSRVSSSHLYAWLLICGSGLRRRHSELGDWYDLSAVCFGESLTKRLEELYRYCTALCQRGPPRKDALRGAAIRYGMRSGGFLIGIPSQGRRRGVSS
jgi:hypothetical protein